MQYRPLPDNNPLLTLPERVKDGPYAYLFGAITYVLAQTLVLLIVSLVVVQIAVMSGIVTFPAEASLEEKTQILNDSAFIAVYLNLFVDLFAAVSLLIIFRKSLHQEFKEMFKFNKLGTYLGIIVFAYVLNIVIDAAYATVFLPNEENSDNQAALIRIFESGYVVEFIIFTVFLAPIFEEIVFRKIIFHYIKFDGLAIICSGLLFGLLHVYQTNDYIHLFPYAVSGMIIAWIYYYFRKNIWSVIYYHAINNSIALLAMFYLVNNPTSTETLETTLHFFRLI